MRILAHHRLYARGGGATQRKIGGKMNRFHDAGGKWRGVPGKSDNALNQWLQGRRWLGGSRVERVATGATWPQVARKPTSRLLHCYIV